MFVCLSMQALESFRMPHVMRPVMSWYSTRRPYVVWYPISRRCAALSVIDHLWTLSGPGRPLSERSGCPRRRPRSGAAAGTRASGPARGPASRLVRLLLCSFCCFYPRCMINTAVGPGAAGVGGVRVAGNFGEFSLFSPLFPSCSPLFWGSGQTQENSPIFLFFR